MCFQEAVARLQHKNYTQETTTNLENDFGLHNLDIGPPISKGCAAVVYGASYKRDANEPKMTSRSPTPEQSPISVPETISPIQNISRFVHNFGTSVDSMHFNQTAVSSTDDEDDLNRSIGRADTRRVRFDSGANVHYPTSSISAIDSQTFDTDYQPIEHNDIDIQRYPLALKMMFNYDIQSNAMAILRAMYKETIPAVHNFMNPEADGWEKLLMEQTVRLPAHPNIVQMYGVFCAQVPNLMQSTSLYPMALPPRINPNGYGRNMSLFLLMKRYNSSLYDYLNSDIEIPMRTRLLIFAQLLEGAAHLYRHGVAHRDLKSDNLLIDLNGNDMYPILVLSDFGCCLADKNNGLSMPYTSYDVDKGGNTALMAPEIICKTPGTFSVLDYSKSDLWACGALAYEIFDGTNPFYEQGNRDDENAVQIARLTSTNYKETDLPALNANVPSIVRKLIANFLQRNPNQRLRPDIAANVMQLYLWAPSAWLKPKTNINSPEILQWLLSLTTKILYEGRLYRSSTPMGVDAFGFPTNHRRTYTEYLLISSFLIRSRLEPIRRALDWIQHENDLCFI